MIKIISNKTCGQPTHPEKVRLPSQLLSYCLEISAICNGALGTVFDCLLTVALGSAAYWLVFVYIGMDHKQSCGWPLVADIPGKVLKQVTIDRGEFDELIAINGGADAELNNCKQWRHVPGLTSDRTDRTRIRVGGSNIYYFPCSCGDCVGWVANKSGNALC